jgi:hypothetical protein
MKKVFLLCTAMLVSASVAMAAGVLDIGWDTCAGDGGLSLRTFACTSNLNTGANTNTLVPSITLDADVANFNGFDTHVYVGFGSTIPDWWGVMGTCAGKTTPIAASSPASLCSNDPYAALGAGGTVPLPNNGILNANNNAFEVRFAFAVPAGNEQTLFANTEYPTCNFVISNAKTTGTGNCTGCSTPACIRFNQVTYGQAGGIANDVTTGGTQQNAFWQDGAADCSGTPVKNRTWGAVKSLYR